MPSTDLTKRRKRRVASEEAKKVAADKTIRTKTRLKDGTFLIRSFDKIGPARSRGDVLHHRGPPTAIESQLKKLRERRKKKKKKKQS